MPPSPLCAIEKFDLSTVYVIVSVFLQYVQAYFTWNVNVKRDRQEQQMQTRIYTAVNCQKERDI